MTPLARNVTRRGAAPGPAPTTDGPSSGSIGLTPQQLGVAFPFHLACDRDLRLRQVGSALTRLCPDVIAGALLDAHFRLQQPDVPLAFADLTARREHPCLLEHLRSGLVLQGQLCVDDGAGTLLFLGSPRITDVQQMRALGLTLEDFPRHTPIAALLEGNAQHAAALRDARESDAERAAANAELRHALETLQARLSEVAAAPVKRNRGDSDAARLRQEIAALGALSSDPIVIVHGSGEPSYANPAFLRLCALAGPDAAGLDTAKLDAVFAELADPAAPPVPLQRLRHDGSDLLRLVRPKRCDYRRTLHHVGGTPNAPAARIIQLHDVAQDAAGDRLPADFLALAAHELRTPVSSVVGYAELLLSRDFDEATRRDLLATVHRQATLLVTMITKLLDLARIEARAGRDFRIRPEPLRAIVDAAVAELINPDERHRIRVAAPGASPVANVDADRMMQAVRNVIDNACRFSPGGEPVVVEFAHSEDAGRALAGIVVRDQGIGMTREQSVRVFDRFYRADPAGPISGIGLGMSLVKEVVDLLGGRVDVASGLGKGTTVTLWVPASPAPANASAPPRPTRRHSHAR